MYSHASSGLQQWSTCITHNTCKTASLCFHCDERLNHIISCQCRTRCTQTTTGVQLRQLSAPAPQPPSNDEHSTTEDHEKHQGPGIPPHCLLTNTALPLVKIPLAMAHTQHRQPEKTKKTRRISQVSLNLSLQGSHPSNEQTLDLVSFYELSKIAEQGTAQLKHGVSSPINPYPSFKNQTELLIAAAVNKTHQVYLPIKKKRQKQNNKLIVHAPSPLQTQQNIICQCSRASTHMKGRRAGRVKPWETWISWVQAYTLVATT